MSNNNNENNLFLTLISQLQSTEEYKRSNAISESINFLLNKISLINNENKEILNKNKELDLNFKNLNEKIFKLEKEKELIL